jgi:hypothetical protein
LGQGVFQVIYFIHIMCSYITIKEIISQESSERLTVSKILRDLIWVLFYIYVLSSKSSELALVY